MANSKPKYTKIIKLENGRYNVGSFEMGKYALITDPAYIQLILRLNF